MFLYVLFITIGFISGSIMFSHLIPKKLFNIDVCNNSNDNNPGAFNVFKNCGVKVGLVCLFLDILKGIIPVLLSTLVLDINNILFALVMISPVLGHAIGIFNEFNGGKCISTSFGVLLGLLNKTYIVLLLAFIYIFFVIIFKNKSNYKKSIATYTLFAISSFIILFINDMHIIALGCVGISIITIYKHYYAQVHIVSKESLVDERKKTI